MNVPKIDRMYSVDWSNYADDQEIDAPFVRPHVEELSIGDFTTLKHIQCFFFFFIIKVKN